MRRHHATSPIGRRIRRIAVAGTLIAALTLSGCAASPGRVGVAHGGAMGDGGVVMPPAGWLDYCARHGDDPSCQAAAMTPARRHQLDETLAAVRRLPALTDAARFGQGERWEAADARGGDCEDVALAARARLRELGWPPGSLRLATAFTEQGDYHLVLSIDVAVGRRRDTLILDRRLPRVEPWRQVRAVGYRFVARQAAAGATWVAIADGVVPPIGTGTAPV